VTGNSNQLLMLHDDRSDITLAQLEKILQGIVWLADGIVLPFYAKPSTLVDAEEQRLVTTRLAELAEAGYLRQWRISPRLSQVSVPTWWPAGTRAHEVDGEAYRHLHDGIQVAVSLYRDDLLRGMGRPAQTMMSGISEFVSLQNSLWTIGLARFLSTDYLLSSDSRSLAVSWPLRQLAAAGNAVEPVSRTIMELHDVGSLTLLSVSDIARLRRFKPTARALIADVVNEVEGDVGIALDQQRFVDAAVESTRRHYTELLGEAVQQTSRNANTSNMVGLGITVAGTIFPPLNALSFMQPLIGWNAGGRPGRRLVTFLAKLKKRTHKSG
jgi:hypothetical protein